MATTAPTSSRVRVAVRVRPFQQRLDSNMTAPCVDRKSSTCIALRQTVNETTLEQQFPFDNVYMQDAQQEEIFENEVEPLIGSCFDGKNVTVLCYGPTGSGKTYSCVGTPNDPGIISWTVSSLLETAEEFRASSRGTNSTCSVLTSMIEIYNEKVYDLMTGDLTRDLPIRQSSKNEIVIPNLTSIPVDSQDTFDSIFNENIKRRRVAFTKLNAHSSRSHCIIMFHIIVRTKTSPVQTRTAKLYLVDLAGSENNKQTGNRGVRMTESVNINKSLFNLGHVIDCLRKRTNTAKPPYRNSKLTRLLQDSLGGTARSVMICHVSPSIKHFAVTQKCLSFGSNTRKIVNTVVEHVSTEKQEIIIVGEDGKETEEEDHEIPKRRSSADEREVSPQPTTSAVGDVDETSTASKLAEHDSKFEQMERELKKLRAQVDAQAKPETVVEQEEMDVDMEAQQPELVEDDGLPAPMTPLTSSRMVIAFVKKAKTCAQDGNWHKAKKYYNRALRLHPADERIAKKVKKMEAKIAAEGNAKEEEESSQRSDVEEMIWEESDKENNRTDNLVFETPVVKNRRRRPRAKRTLPNTSDDEPPRKKVKLDLLCDDEKREAVVLSWFNDWSEGRLREELLGVGVKTAMKIVQKRPYSNLRDCIARSALSEKQVRTLIEKNGGFAATE